MSDLAALQFRVDSDGINAANKSLEKLATTTERTEKATESFGRTQRTTTSASQAMLASIERAVTELRDLHLGFAEGAMQAMKEAQALKEVETATRKAAAAAKEAQNAYAGFYDSAQKNFATQYVAQMTQVQRGHTGAIGTSRALQAATLNLGRQFTDVGVTAALGMSPLLIMVQQGPQIADALGLIRAEGVNVGSALKGMAGSALAMVGSMAPLLVIVGTATGAFLLWRKVTDDAKASLEESAKAAADFVEVQGNARDALSQAISFTDKYKVSNDNLSNALDGILKSQNAAYGATLDSIDATDKATRAAAQRAEVERLLAVQVLRRAAAEATANAQKSEQVAKDARGRALLGSALGSVGLADSPEAFAAAVAQGQAQGFKARGGDVAEKAAAQERALADALNAQADALMSATLILPDATDKTKAHAKATKDATDAIKEYKVVYTAASDVVAVHLESIAIKVPKVTEQIVAFDGKIADSMVLADDWAGNLELAASKVEDAFIGVASSIDRVFYAISSQNWGGAVSGLIKAMGEVKTSYSSVGLLGTIGNVAGAFAPHAGGSIGNALGLFSAAGQLGSLGASALPSTVISPMVLQSATGLSVAGVSGGVAGSTGLLGSIGGALASNPIGWALMAAALASSFLGPKPSNHGAGYDLVTGAMSGNKRNSETEAAVKTAGDAILAGQKLLNDAGITLMTEVRGLVIGTRDQSQIYLKDGRTLNSAVGDPAAAVETAMKALLDGATYASEAQEKLVKSMVAAGDSFDDIATALENLKSLTAEASAFGKSIGDAIAQLQNPSLYSVTSLQSQQAGRYAQLDAYLSGGALTQSQYDAQKAQLGQLDSLELANLMTQLTGQLGDLTSSTSDAASSARDMASTFTSLAKTLRDYQGQLTGSIASTASPLTAFRQTQGAFRSIAGSTDPSVLAGLPGAGSAYIAAALAIAPDKATYQRVQAEVRNATEKAAKYAEDQATVAEKQLDELTKLNDQVAKDASIQQVVAAISALGTLIVQNQINSSGGGAYTSLPSWFDVNRYIADNPDLTKNWNAGGSLHTVGSTLQEAAAQHFLIQGQNEIAAGTRGYASGTDNATPGWHWVGEEGPELMRMRGGEQVISNDNLSKLSRGPDISAVVNKLDSRLEKIERALVQGVINIRRVEYQLEAANYTGLYVRGEKDGSPVKTVAA